MVTWGCIKEKNEKVRTPTGKITKVDVRVNEENSVFFDFAITVPCVCMPVVKT